ncbi:MAG: peptidylprolyl isomerase [Alphaproteobacteria bacterium]|nr:peptidylprolyl isomerase [Alphaproteobacteria bacterium]
MVKKIRKETNVTETSVQISNKKTSVVRISIASVLFVVTAFIWYQVGVVLFGFTGIKAPVMKAIKKTYSEETVVAEINGHLIKLKDVRAFVQDVPQLSELPFEMIYPQVLDNMINTRVLVSGAEATGVSKEADVRKALKMAREQILSQAYLTKQLEKEMTPEVLQALYLEEMKNYEPQEEIKARHILVDSQKEAENILFQLKAGANFATLANEKSTDKNANGGDLGDYFTANMMIPEFSRPVFALKKGELSAPIKTPYGWHIVLVEDKRLAEAPAFEVMQDALKQLYAERNMKNVLQAERDKANVKVYQPNL